MLTACTTYQEGFDCAARPGVGCQSITQVDRLIEQGKLGRDEEVIEEESIASKQYKQSDHPLKKKGVQVWLAPYEDENGTWHATQTLFVPLKSSQE